MVLEESMNSLSEVFDAPEKGTRHYLRTNPVVGSY